METTISEELELTVKSLDSIIKSGESPKKKLSSLDEWGIDWHVTEGGSLMIKSWQIGDKDFVDSQTAATIRSSRPLDKESKQLDWLSKNLKNLCDEYSNKWVAIHDEKVVANGQTVSELMQKIEGLDRPLITFIPSERIVWTFAYGN